MSIGLQELLEAGVHFGHQTRRWNPKMKPFIFEARNGIHLIDLTITVNQLDAACEFLTGITRKGGKVLLVGTKKQAQQCVQESAAASGQPHICERWLGGTLTNLKTIKGSLKRLNKIEAMEADGTFALYVKQEQASLRRKKDRLVRNLGGIRGLDTQPDAMFVIDINREHIAVAEARRLKVPIVAIVDTNCNPDLIDYPIAGNDDAIRSIRLIMAAVTQALYQGKIEYEAKHARKTKDKDAAPALAPAEIDPAKS